MSSSPYENSPNPPSDPYVPPLEYFSAEKRIHHPRRVALSPAWLFDAVSYHRLRMGHEAQGDLYTWNCYLGDATEDAPAGSFHAHHTNTGFEIYRMPLEGDGFTYSTGEFFVEVDPERYRSRAAMWPPEDAVFTNVLALVLRDVMQAPPLRLR